MRWYAKYLSVFEKSYDTIPSSLWEEVKIKLNRFKAFQPLVSLVVIAHNEESRLLACLWSLADNECHVPIEIIGINNYSTDRTEEIFKRLGTPYFNELRPGAGYARQCGLEHARGKYYFCIDSDTLYPPHYIQNMLKKLRKSEVVGVSALYNYIPDEKHSSAGLKAYQLLRDFHVWATSIKRPEMSIRGAVFAFSLEEGRRYGFRTDIRRGEDGSMGFCLKQCGKLSITLDPRVRAVTSARTLDADGSLFQSFKVRFLKYLKEIKSYFTSKKEYRDEPENLLP